MNGQGGNIHLLYHITLSEISHVDLLFLSINIHYTKNVWKMEFRYESCKAAMLIECIAVLQNAV